MMNHGIYSIQHVKCNALHCVLISLEACKWAFFLFAVASGGWWTLASPILMTFLLLKVSGVAMLEKTIVSRRPGYAEYVQKTRAFIPGPRRSLAPQQEIEL